MTGSKKDSNVESAIKKVRQQEEDNKVEEYKKKLANDRSAARMAEYDALNKKMIVRHDERTGRDITLRDELNDKIETVLMQEVEAYKDWRSAVISMLNMCTIFNKMLYYELGRSFALPASQFIMDHLIAGGIGDRFIKPPEEITLPSLEYNVNVTKDNKLELKPLIRTDIIVPDDSPISEGMKQVNDAFKVLIVKWLEGRGYMPTNADQTEFANDQGVVLTPKILKELKEDPDNGLQVWLAEDTSLNYTPTPSPR